MAKLEMKRKKAINPINIYTWNINGLRSGLKKGFISWIEELKPDILCLQEIRTDDKNILKEIEIFLGYKIFFNSAQRKGYSGTALLSLETPAKVIYSTKNSEFDDEGRFILAEFESFTVINCYVPNGRGNLRVDFKIQFLDFILLIAQEYTSVPVIICGDFNIAHNDIDLHSPEKNKNKTGFLASERVFFDNLIALGYVDIYRKLLPDDKGYTWWNQAGNFKELDLGWRFDYIWIHRKYIKSIISIRRYPEYVLSDHCPIKIEIDLKLLK
jgi:exodeoxyribonuclease-3